MSPILFVNAGYFKRFLQFYKRMCIQISIGEFYTHGYGRRGDWFAIGGIMLHRLILANSVHIVHDSCSGESSAATGNRRAGICSSHCRIRGWQGPPHGGNQAVESRHGSEPLRHNTGTGLSFDEKQDGTGNRLNLVLH